VGLYMALASENLSSGEVLRVGVVDAAAEIV
jgi:hypothetical protein